MKGLPLAYAKDMQEDKEPVFEAFDTLALCLAAMHRDDRDGDRSMRRGCAPRPETAFPTATDLADWLVRVKGLPFRRAHHVAGAIVKAAEARGCAAGGAAAGGDAGGRPGDRRADVFAVLGVEASVASRTSEGGTAPARVRAAVAAARRRFLG